jgi:sphingosine kinase
MQWPVATSGQGVLDVVVQSVVSCPTSSRTHTQVPRATMVNAITGAEKGEAYWMTCQHYYKGECSSATVVVRQDSR